MSYNRVRVGEMKKLALVVVLLSMVASCEGITPLMFAAKDGDAIRVSKVIANGANVDETSDYGWTALMFAAHSGHAEVVEVLLDAGADPNIESERYSNSRVQVGYPASNALREAIDNGHIDIAKRLLDAGAEPDAKAFAMAGGTNDLALLEKMLAMGADPNPKSPSPYHLEETALCVASGEGNLEAVQWLIDSGADPNLEAPGCNAFLSAVRSDRLEVAKLLLAHGADPNVQLWPSMETPFMTCVRRHSRTALYDPNFEMLDLLLANNVNREHRTDHWPWENRSGLEYARYQRDRVDYWAELPAFDAEWPGGTPQFVAKHDALIERLQD